MLPFIAVVVCATFAVAVWNLRIKYLDRAELRSVIADSKARREDEHDKVVDLLNGIGDLLKDILELTKLVRDLVTASRDNRVETAAKVEEVKRVLVDSPTREDIRRDIKSVPDKTAEKVAEILPDVLADTLKGGGKNGGHI